MESTNRIIGPLLTDLYQLTMAYVYWKNGRHNSKAVFDLFFRKNPFGGEFTIFAGLDEAIKFVENFRFLEDEIKYIRSIMSGCDEGFFDWLKMVDCSDVELYAIREGSVVFPRIPLIRVEGPLAIIQLLETTFLNLINYPSLVATNAARFRLAAGKEKNLLEFGLRRAQGPDGGLSASRYTYLGGFNATSDVLAGMLFNIPVKGTHAHSFVSSFSDLRDLSQRQFICSDGSVHRDFTETVLQYRKMLDFSHTNEGELASFIAYAQAFPKGFLALVDTYDTLNSGVPNFLSVALAVNECGYQPLGVRLDSGDLAYLSKEVRKMFHQINDRFNNGFDKLSIVASNDIDEEIIHSLNQQGNEIDIFGVGTHLVTCKAQPALGCVYKLMEFEGHPRIKLSQDIIKITLPGRKEAYRLIGSDGVPILDLMIQVGEKRPKPGERILCRDPFNPVKRAYVIPAEVLPLHENVWKKGKRQITDSLEDARELAQHQLWSLREDHRRAANPTPYKISVSEQLYNFLHSLWESQAPIAEIR